jgi:type II secretory pathway component GspD/PulD (secretin)
MKLQDGETGRRIVKTAPMAVGIAMALVLFVPCAGAQTQAAETKPDAESYQTFYIVNVGQPNDLNDIQNALRNMLPKARLFAVASQNAISVHGTQEDIALARRIVGDLDRARKVYRLTYTITEIDDGKRVGSQRLGLVVTPGQKTVLKQGSKVPVVTGPSGDGKANQNLEVQYVDVGLNIDATTEAIPEGVRLRTKVEQSSLADEKSGLGAQDPVIRQTLLDDYSTLVEGKPLVLGSLDIPGSTRRQEIEVVAELVR